MGELAYVNGAFCDPGAARVSIEDRGFQFADGVYEGIAAYGGRPFLLERHVARLRQSLRGVRIDYEAERIEPIVREGIARAGLGDTFVYVQVTRGAAPRGHGFPAAAQPTVVMTFRPLPRVPEELRAGGVELVSHVDDRWGHCDIKSTMLLANVLALQGARDAGAYDAVFVSEAGEVYETSLANVFLVRAGRLITPAKCHKILSGVTRDFVIECARGRGMAVEERRVLLDELLAADEAFITSTTREILGVARVDGQAIGRGGVGATTCALHESFLAGVRAACGR